MLNLLKIGAAAMLAIAGAAPARAQSALGTLACEAKTCSVRLTGDQLLSAVEKLVSAGRFDEALPLIEALKKAPGYSLQTRFLTGYIASRVQQAGIGKFEDLGLCTYAEPERFYSFRRATHQSELDYGRHINAIALHE